MVLSWQILGEHIPCLNPQMLFSFVRNIAIMKHLACDYETPHVNIAYQKGLAMVIFIMIVIIE